MSLADEKGTIILGGAEYPIQAFTLDQLQIVAPCLQAYFAAVNAKAPILSAEVQGPAAKIISAALSKPETEITASLEEIGPAVSRIAEVAGLLRLGELLEKATQPKE